MSVYLLYTLTALVRIVGWHRVSKKLSNDMNTALLDFVSYFSSFHKCNLKALKFFSDSRMKGKSSRRFFFNLKHWRGCINGRLHPFHEGILSKWFLHFLIMFYIPELNFNQKSNNWAYFKCCLVIKSRWQDGAAQRSSYFVFWFFAEGTTVSYC